MSTSIVLLLVEKMVDEDNTWVTFISGKGDGQKDSERPTQDPPSQPQGTSHHQPYSRLVCWMVSLRDWID